MGTFKVSIISFIKDIPTVSDEVSIHGENDLRTKIYTVRGVQVMLDFDLAEIYGYDTRSFNKQVHNNIERFDEDFRFQLTKEEFDELILMCKIYTSSWGGTRNSPMPLPNKASTCL